MQLTRSCLYIYISTYHFVGRRVHALNKKYFNAEKDDLDLKFISLSKVVKATNNFSIDNKLGEGGFGPVYKVTSLVGNGNGNR